MKEQPVRDSTPVDTVGILRSIEDRFGLPHLSGAANAANGSIDSLLNTPTGALVARSITNSSHATAVAGRSFRFSVTTTGTPTPKLKIKGKLPRGLHFHDNRNGTGTISGTPSTNRSVGSHALTITATFGKGKTKQTAQQAFTLTVNT